MASSPAALDAIIPLVERFPAISSDERAILLDWARATPLIYGAWKPFKSLYKKAEAPALENAASDVELLGVLLGRVDAAPIPSAAPRLKLVEKGTVLNGKSVAFEGGSFSVGGRTQYDWSGFRLTANYGANSPGLLGGLSAVRRLFGLAAAEPAGEAKSATWDFQSHDYISGIKSVRLDDALLRIETQYGNKSYAIDVADVTFPHLQNQSPLPATWQYMKRRARRLGRESSRKNPTLYWDLLRQMLRESGRDELDFAVQWASVDALYARSSRWIQKRAGRGPYQRQAGFNRRRREERAPEIWDAHLDDVRALYVDETVPVQACATALKVLWAHHQAIAPLSPRQTERFLNGPSPILTAMATRSLTADWENGAEVSGATAAAAYLAVGGSLRRRLNQLVEAKLADAPAAWRKEFAKRLLQTVDGATQPNAKRARRVRLAAVLLSERLSEFIDDDALFRHLEMWLELNATVADWALGRVRQSGARGETKRLAALSALPVAWREYAVAAFIADAASARPSANGAFDLVTTDDVETNRIGWQYLGATAIEPSDIRALFKKLLDRWFDNHVYGPAFSEAGATRLFERAQWSAKDIGDWTRDYYYSPWNRILPFASADFFIAALRFLPPDQAPRRAMLSLNLLRAEVAIEVAPRLEEWARDFKPTLADLQSLTWTSATWQFVASSAIESETLLLLWPKIWQLPIDAVSAPFAIALLERAAISDDTLGDWLATIGEVKNGFAPDFFVYLMRRVAGGAKVLLMLGATPEQWSEARPILLEMLRESGLRVAFWNGIWEQLRGERNEILLARLNADAALSMSFERIDKESIDTFLATTEPSHEPFLLRWLDAHQSTVERDDTALIAAATCALERVRERGLNRVRELGLDLPLALRLMESDLPPAVALGRFFFESNEGADASDLALALCDSPQASVRAFGREFILARQGDLLSGDLLQKLAENSDPAMQAWVGEQLLALPTEMRADAKTSEFDRAVLRGRGRARRAKEAVKTRIAQSPIESEVDVEALLEVARGSTKSDREWALQQLAALALSGREIAGVTIKSPV